MTDKTKTDRELAIEWVDGILSGLHDWERKRVDRGVYKVGKHYCEDVSVLDQIKIYETIRQALQTPAPECWDKIDGIYQDEGLLAPLFIYTTDSLGNPKRYQHDGYMIVRIPPAPKSEKETT